MKFLKDLRTGATIALGFTLTLGVTVLLAQTLNEFASGDLVSASAINANFTNLKNRLDAPLPIVSADATGNPDLGGVTALTPVAGLSLTVTTSGSPIWIGLQNKAGTDGLIYINGSPPGCQAQIQIFRGSSLVVSFQPRFTLSSGSLQTTMHYPPSSVWAIDTPGAGTYTYSVSGRDLGPGCINFLFQNVRLTAMRFNET